MPDCPRYVGNCGPLQAEINVPVEDPTRGICQTSGPADMSFIRNKSFASDGLYRSGTLVVVSRSGLYRTFGAQAGLKGPGNLCAQGVAATEVGHT